MSGTEVRPSSHAVSWTRAIVLALGLLLMLSGLLPLLSRTHAATSDATAAGPRVELSPVPAKPRPLEDTTEAAVIREYGLAWKNLASALEENNAGFLNESFLGVARQKLGERVAAQQAAGTRTRIIDHGHKLEAIFYSHEGSAIQLRDVASLEFQVLDGNDVVSSETVEVKYLAVMTVGDVRWKVRILESVNAF